MTAAAHGGGLGLRRLRAARAVSAGALLGLLLVALPAGASAVAMVTDLVGSAWRAAGGEKSGLGVLDSLGEGAEIGIDPGAVLVLTYLAAPVEYRVQGPARVVVEAGGVAGRYGNEPSSRRLAGAVGHAIRPVDVAQASIVMRAVPGRAPALRLANLTGGQTSETRPTFRWTGPEGPYRFELTDAAGKVVHSANLETTAYRLPAERALVPGAAYSWRVTALGALPGEAWGDFRAASEVDRARAAAARPAPGAPFSERVRYAALLHGLDLTDEAKAQWRALAVERPEAANLRFLAR